MPTLKQIEANRQNAHSSTGPRTEAGKAVSSRNALKSGIYSNREVLPDEDPAELEALKQEYYSHFQPASPDERDLVDDLVSYTWLKRRFRRMEALLVAVDSDKTIYQNRVSTTGHVYDYKLRDFTRLQTRMNAAHRNYRQSHADLIALQAARRAAEAAQSRRQPAAVSLEPAETKPGSSELGSFCQTENSLPAPAAVTFAQPPAAAENHPLEDR
jgi:hypothetical protein